MNSKRIGLCTILLAILTGIVVTLFFFGLVARAEESETKDITIHKKWEDDGNRFGTRPDDLSVHMSYEIHSPFEQLDNRILHAYYYDYHTLLVTADGSSGASGSIATPESLRSTFIHIVRNISRRENISWPVSADDTDDVIWDFIYNKLIVPYRERYPDTTFFDVTDNRKEVYHLLTDYWITLPDGTKKPVYIIAIYEPSSGFIKPGYANLRVESFTVETGSDEWDKTGDENGEWSYTFTIPKEAINIKIWEDVPAGYNCAYTKKSPLTIDNDAELATLTNTLIKSDITVVKETTDGASGEAFDFRVKAKNSSGQQFDFSEVSAAQASDQEGVYTFSITAGDSAGMTLPGVPYGFTYEIWEEPAEGWQLAGVDSDSRKTMASQMVHTSFPIRHVFTNESGTGITVNKTAEGGNGTFTFRFRGEREGTALNSYYAFYGGEGNDYSWTDLNGNTFYDDSVAFMDIDSSLYIGGVQQIYPYMVSWNGHLYFADENYQVKVDATDELARFVTSSTPEYTVENGGYTDNFYKTNQTVTYKGKQYALYSKYQLTEGRVNGIDFYVIADEDSEISQIYPYLDIEIRPAGTEQFSTEQDGMTETEEDIYEFSIKTSGGTGSFVIRNVPAGTEYELWEKTAEGWELLSIDGDTGKTATQDGDSDSDYSKATGRISDDGDRTYEHTFANETDGTVQIEYTVTVIDDGNGTGSASPESGTEGTEVSLSAEPDEGYEFAGWEVISGGVTLSDPYSAEATFEIGTEDVEVKANFEKKEKVTVTFESDGGSDVESQELYVGEKANEPADPTREGYTFKGWYLGDTIFDFDTEIEADITLTAKWEKSEEDPGTEDPTDEKKKYTITYVLNGGTLDGKTGTVSVPYEEGTKISLPAPTREGYTFDYWEGSRYDAGQEYEVTEDHQFSAQWIKDSEDVPGSGDSGDDPGSGDSGDDPGTGDSGDDPGSGDSKDDPGSGDSKDDPGSDDGKDDSDDDDNAGDGSDDDDSEEDSNTGSAVGSDGNSSSGQSAASASGAAAAQTISQPSTQQMTGAPAKAAAASTGDMSRMHLWLAVLTASLLALACTVVLGRRKER